MNGQSKALSNKAAKSRAVVRAAPLVLGGARDVMPPNRALVLYERTGDSWRAVRAHGWHAAGKDQGMKTITTAPTSDGNEPRSTGLTAAATAPGLGLTDEARAASINGLTLLLADAITVRDLYKKHHWQASGPSFYALHLLYDKHAGEQGAIVDALAERIQTLGGFAIAMGGDVARITRIEAPPREAEPAAAQFLRLLRAHEQLLVAARTLARHAAALGDDGTADLVISEVVRTNELEAWFLKEQLPSDP